jgi:hypothetical protein
VAAVVALPLVLPPTVLGFYLLVPLGPQGFVGQFMQSLGLGLVITLVTLPLRIGVLWSQRRFIAGESAMGSLRVATALMPTLIFTLVLATILRERYQISDALYGALLLYAGVSTILPSLILARSVDFNLLVGPLPPPGAARGPLRD